MVTRGPGGACLGRRRSIQERQANRCTAECHSAGGVATAAGETSRAGVYLCRETAWACQHLGLEKGLETCRHREFPLARLEAHLGLMASAIRYADARAAAARRLAVFGDGRTLRASGARPSRTSGGRLDSLFGLTIWLRQIRQRAGDRPTPCFVGSRAGINLRPTIQSPLLYQLGSRPDAAIITMNRAVPIRRDAALGRCNAPCPDGFPHAPCSVSAGPWTLP